MASNTDHSLPSVGVFCPQSKAPDAAYLNSIHNYLLSTPYLQPLVDAIRNLQETWQIFSNHRQDIASLKQGHRYMQAFAQWIATGQSESIAGHMSGIFALPLLTIVQICQYFQYLEARRISHEAFRECVKRGGGIQGYCGGLLPAVAIACSSNEPEVVENSIISMRIALGIGAYGELGDDENIPGPTTVVVRLKRPEQGEELVKRFPGAYLSAVTDPKTISIVGSVTVLEALSAYAREQGLLVQGVHLRGKVHNPENGDLAEDLNELACSQPSLTLPHSRQLRIPIRSNTDGKTISDIPLTSELIHTILARKCEWYTLLQRVADKLEATHQTSHLFAVFGIGDCIPLIPFHAKNLQITKLDVLSYVKQVTAQKEAETYQYPENAIAIVGAACRAPGADDLEELWQLVSRGDSRAVEVPTDRFDIRRSFKATLDPKWTSKQKFWGNFIDDPDKFDHAFFHVSPREAANMDPQQRILLEVAYQALDSSGYLRNHRRESGDHVGCFIGATFVEYLDNTAVHAPTAFTSTGTIRAFLSGKISYHFGWQGPSEVIDTACSSSLVAINRACKAIQSGESPMALAGGVNILTGIHNFLDLTKAGFLSSTGRCKPFDAAADGYCRGEGCGLVVLKPLKQAVAEGQHVLGVIPAVATNQGGLSPSITVPSSSAQKALYRRLLKDSTLEPEQITYVETHGTGTQVGDPLEIASVRQVFAGPSRSSDLYLGSLKANVGHAETAAGVQSLCKVLSMLMHNGLPPVANFKTLNPKIESLDADRIKIPTTTREWDVPFKAACVNSYGASGSNSALLCCQSTQSLEIFSETRAKEKSYPLIVSANCVESLHAVSDSLIRYLGSTNKERLNLADVTFTLAERRKRHPVRLVASVSTSLPPSTALQQTMNDSSKITIPERTKEVCLVFSGQSRRIVGLHEATYRAIPRLRRYIDECDAALVSLGFPSILPSIFSQEPASDVILLQCGTFAVQYACAMSWIDSGLQIGAVVGHSFGELTAMVVAGILSLDDGMRLIATRASLMEAKWGAERGTMLAIHTDKVQVQLLIEESALPLEIACFNSSTSQVVVSTEKNIADFESFLHSKEKGRLRFQRLDVSHGFHSIFTEPLLDDLEATARRLSFKEASIHFESSTHSEKSSVSYDRIREHTRDPVYFEDAILRIEKKYKSCVFIEAGIGSPITSMVKRAVARADQHSYVSLDSGSVEDPAAGFLSATLKLWTEGLEATYIPFLDPMEKGIRQVWLPPYQFQKNQHWLPNVDRAVEIMQRETTASLTVNGRGHLSEVPQLLYTRNTESDSPRKNFDVNVATKRFQAIVAGHAVRDRPLCPASMYMEFAVMALHQTGIDVQHNAIKFSSLEYSSPLGLGSNRNVEISVGKSETPSSWGFEVKSCSKNNPSGKPTTHASGIISIRKPGAGELWAYERLVANRVDQVPLAPGAELLQSNRAYGLFSRVVTYGSVLRGIESVTIAGNEALATIRVPISEADSGESTVATHFDAVSLDAFIQVVGLTINSSELNNLEEVFILSAIDQALTREDIDFRKTRNWTVYAIFNSQGERKVSGDVFVLNQKGELIATYLGCHFTRMSISVLEKLLDHSNYKDVSKEVSRPVKSTTPFDSDSQTSSEGEADLEASIHTDITLPSSDGDTSSDKRFESLKDTIAEFTGMQAGKIPEQSRIGEFGLDSLAATELADEIENIFGEGIPSQELLNESVSSLLDRLQAREPIPNPPKKTKESKHESGPTKTPISNVTRPVSESSPAGFKYDKLTAIIADNCGAPTNTIKLTQSLQSLGVDSLSSVELKASVEDEFQVEIESDQFSLESTVQDIVDFLGSKGLAIKNKQSEDGTESALVKAHKGRPRPIAQQRDDCSPSASRGQQPHREPVTFTYKSEDGVDILADVYLPSDNPSCPMPIAIMIHAGGYMTLSRKAVRPYQTAHLLANGILPVSIDYRLCPEINVFDGAMADVRDSVQWVQDSLSSALEQYGVRIDVKRIGVIGWSTGAHLALTSAWTTRAAGIPIPSAILSFYGPTDFESDDLDVDRNFPERTISIDEIRSSLQSKPLTNYESKGDAKYLDGVGFVRPSDPRSALVLSMFKEGFGLSLILDGIPAPNEKDGTVFKRPNAERIASISPLAQVRRGNCNTPTCVVHSNVDEVVSIASADRFVSALASAGVKHKFLRLSGYGHLHDLLLKPESKKWVESVEPAYDFFVAELFE